MSGSEKIKSEQEHKQQNFWWARAITSKFHVLVVQNNSKEMYKKSVPHVQMFFFCG